MPCSAVVIGPLLRKRSTKVLFKRNWLIFGRIADGRAEDSAEQLQGFTRHRIVIALGSRADGIGGGVDRTGVADGAQRDVEIEQAGARKGLFDTDMRATPQHLLQYRRFQCGGGRQ
jgi:hypothetical protein